MQTKVMANINTDADSSKLALQPMANPVTDVVQ